jgi:hypothetical protein
VSAPRLPRVGLDARDEDELRTILERSSGRNTEACVQEFAKYGVTKFVGSDGDGFLTEITVRRAG